jgi:universal stress protein E
MKRFKNILVGVDLTWGDQFVADELVPPTAAAIERALWLARLNSAKLLFFYAVDASAATQRLIRENHGLEKNVLDQARSALAEVVARAWDKGITAQNQVVFGKCWVEIIRQVLRDQHDLVVVGTRRLGAVLGFLMGSTGIKLLRKCPCPVWVTQPQENQRIKSILVAHDLRPVGDLAMQLGASMAELHGAELHVLHSVEYSDLAYLLPPNLATERISADRRNAKQHIEEQLNAFELTQPAQVRLVTECPDIAILDHIGRHHVDLLVMGTLSHTGVSGLITGNMAERLLPRIPCSVLAVKPDGFVSPITLE